MGLRCNITVLSTFLIAAVSEGIAVADANLQITELWPGGLPGSDATSDWFELTNLGNVAATGLDGNLFYDDNSDDPAAGDALIGIDIIAPGESVIYLVAWENLFDNDRAAAESAFVSMWEPIGDLQIGVVNFGGGLGTEGDAVNVFDGNTPEAMTIDRADYVSSAGEPSFVSDADGTWGPQTAVLGLLGARLGNRSANNMDAGPPVGSPGVVPEPASMALMCLGLSMWYCTRRRRRRSCPLSYIRCQNDRRVRASRSPSGAPGPANPPLVPTTFLVALALCLAFPFGFAPALSQAQSNLQITEIWPGALPGTEFTSDWFEVTNFGNVAATGLNGNLYFDDSSSDPLQSDAMVGIDTIGPGESVIYLTTWEDGFNNVLDDAIAAFVAMWQPPPELQIGSVTLGSGFGGEGDAANIYLGSTADATLVDKVEYEGAAMGVESLISSADGTWLPTVAQVGLLGAYAGFQPADDSSPNPAIGSPGIVPEPTSLTLTLAAVAIVGLRRDRRMRLFRNDR